MTQIYHSQLYGLGDGDVTAEASSLGLPPGQWPQELVVHESQETFFKQKPITLNGEVQGMVYSTGTRRLVVWND